MPHLLCFGYGYSAEVLTSFLSVDQWDISGTKRDETRFSMMKTTSVTPYRYDDPKLTLIFPSVTHVLVSIPPTEHQGDIVLPLMRSHQWPNLQWVGYLSTTGVYGDHNGNEVDENSLTFPPNDRLKRRVQAEQEWLESPFPVHIFRLSGIYGAQRNALLQVQKDTARRILKAGQLFSRIHIEDIARGLIASIRKPAPHAIYNFADNLPEAQEKVVAYAASLLGIAPPPLVPFEDADLSPMARSFYEGNNRVITNQRLIHDLGVKLRYPSYKEGLKSIAEGRCY